MAVSDGGGNVIYRFAYDAYGELSDITTDDGVSLKTTELDTSETSGKYTLAQLAHATGIDYLYNGQYGVMTDQNGLYYMRARYYDQDIKRFINRDVVSGSISNSQSLNRYSYVQGNPVSLTDPFGLCPDPNSNFKNFCVVLYNADWNAIGHGTLDVLGLFWEGFDVANALWYASEGKTEEAIACAVSALPGVGMIAGGLLEKTSRFKNAGKAVKYASRMTQGAIGTVAGAQITYTGLTNIINGIESGTLSAGDVLTFLGGIAITTLSGKNMVSSGRALQEVFGDVGKVSKAGKGQIAGSESGNTGLTIMSRNTGKGNPGAITHFNVNLNNRQMKLLNQLDGYDASVVVRKGDVSLKDLSALTAKTGDEFAMFTRGSQRLIIRGDATHVNIDALRAQELYKAGYRWSGHTHPGVGANIKFASEGDILVLQQFNQSQSVILDSQGKFNVFEK